MGTSQLRFGTSQFAEGERGAGALLVGARPYWSVGRTGRRRQDWHEDPAGSRCGNARPECRHSRLGPSSLSRVPSRQPETTLQAAGKQYGAGWFHRFLMGSEYREVWTTPITVPVLDMDTYAGGVRAVSGTGGQQSKSLRLQATDGRQFFSAQSTRIPRALSRRSCGRPLRRVWRGIRPARHCRRRPGRGPAAQGRRHSPLRSGDRRPARRRAHGEFRSEFAGLMGTIEDRVGGSGPAAHWGGATEIVLTDTLFARLERSSDDQVDGPAFLTARLFDVLIGDWDRHRDQWRWAYFGDSLPRRWVPIPLDRDQAFAKYDGFLLWIARQSAPQLTDFKGAYSNPVGAAWNGRDLDRRLLIGLSWSDWEAVVSRLTAALSDSVIQDAVAALPPEHLQLIGSRLTEWIIQRRNGLPKEARKYYRDAGGRSRCHRDRQWRCG